MKKIIKILFLYFLINLTTQIATAQTGWFQQVSPVVANFRTVYFINDLTGWVVGAQMF